MLCSRYKGLDFDWVIAELWLFSFSVIAALFEIILLLHDPVGTNNSSQTDNLVGHEDSMIGS